MQCLGFVAGEDNILGAQGRGPMIQQRGRDWHVARLAQERFELVQLGEALEDHRIISVKSKSAACEVSRDFDQEDIGQRRKRSLIVVPVGREIIDEAHETG
ncbi:hypothetical protein D9M73_128110 [compost metagenome]